MYGYRARIGVILPSTNTVMEPELWAMAPEGVSIHTSRMKLHKTNPETLKEMALQAERALEELKTCPCDVMIYGCTSGSFIKGAQWESDFRARLNELAGVPVVTTSSAVMDALAAFGKKKIAIVTPYIQSINETERDFFTKQGYDVLDVRGLGIEDASGICLPTPDVCFRMCKEIVTPETELVFISCTGFRSMEVIATLEKDLGIPVISSNLCSMWAALRAAGVQEKPDGFGSLMQF